MSLVLIYLHTKGPKIQPKACITIIKYVIILIDKHTNENHHVGYNLSVWEGQRYEYKKSLSDNYNSSLNSAHNFRNPYSHI